MAGGIDWFRWHHGTVTDQKFPLIAKRAGASVAEVIAVWACVLESASQNDDQRGALPGIPDFEAMDCALGMAEGRSEAIYLAMGARGLVDQHQQLAAWPRRQPKREREDTTAADRKRAQRERDAAGRDDSGHAEGDQVTPCHATSHQKTPRGEESREENSPSLRSGEAAPKRATPPAGPDDVDAQVWADWTQLRKAKKAPITGTVVQQARKEASKAGMTFEAFLRVWCARGSQGLQADWLKPQERASPVAETTYQRSMRDRVNAFTPGIAARAPAPRETHTLIPDAAGVLELPK